MKKKLLFMVIDMNIGGTEKALLNMIAEIPREKYEISILMLEKRGGFLYAIPDHVHVICLHQYIGMKAILNDPPKKTILKKLREGGFITAMRITGLFLLAKVLKERRLLYRFVLKKVPTLKDDYDVAVAYAGPMDLISYFVINKVNAKKKIQWIHFDVTRIGFNRNFAAKVYKKFDKVYAVSQAGNKKLVEIIPDLKRKTAVFNNIISPALLLKQADDGIGFDDQFNGIRILTVGRLSREKGQDLAIGVLARLKETGLHVRWYCIGEGNARAEYEKLIEQYGLKKDFVLLGANPNPYPFMKQCDIYVQPSRHEGYCITLGEAKCFIKPIIATDFVGAREQLKKYNSGTVINFDESEMFEKIQRIAMDEGDRWNEEDFIYG